MKITYGIMGIVSPIFSRFVLACILRELDFDKKLLFIYLSPFLRISAF